MSEDNAAAEENPCEGERLLALIANEAPNGVS